MKPTSPTPSPPVLRYKGYLGSIEPDLDAGCLSGTVHGIDDTVHYEGQTLAQLHQAFVESVDDYLAMCDQRGEQPNAPYSGKFLTRVGEDLHRQAASLAAARGISLNELVTQTLRRETTASTPD